MKKARRIRERDRDMAGSLRYEDVEGGRGG